MKSPFKALLNKCHGGILFSQSAQKIKGFIENGV